MNKKIKINDTRKVNSWGATIQKPRTGEYDANVIKQIAVAAKRQGVDPYTALAVAMQETNLGTIHENYGTENWGQVRWDKWGKDEGLKSEITKNHDVDGNATALAYILKKHMSESEDANEATRIQGYNGYLLRPDNDVYSNNMYGIDLKKYPKGYDLKADPRYGRAVIDLRDNVLKKSPDIADYLTQLGGEENPLLATIRSKLKK